MTRTAVALLLTLALAGCVADRPRAEVGDSARMEQTSDASPGEPELEVVEGRFDVGGHSMYLQCTGSGAPTVVYLHGSIQDSDAVPHTSGAGFARLLASEHRTCVYDRRNVGWSDTVDTVQLPRDAIEDLRGLLDVAAIKPPYVLVGASFGGMLAYLYANEHSQDVVGMVLLDSMFPDELSLEHLFPPHDTLESYSVEDEASLERISHYKALAAGQQFIGKEPAIPVIYLASESEGYEDNDFGVPEYSRRILELQRAYVDRFSPGELMRVDAPHFMEPVIPELIADQVRAVVTEAARSTGQG